ncbi:MULTISPECIES: DUF1667 domain-containing protein [Clostridium]|uniref:DUF1667 domain-containing protein n=3 Tax=Clostridium TaxID=1485 RepID=D8GK08_CLOLD|nr:MULTISPECIES: DUF1667 domain-containing protein [Clostridium]ADK13126.1 conserved hypothetical protein [Clostridium ljungdahlii DSM 13528]AGY76349.1 DUF1667 domain-containing protein [Clostridium autoethanogenum DSM 10061]ALU36512.1 hypothetical protein CLAU_2083 [Clostridium autoethanogenum DSM 10061]OAA84364.1 hypothetical protein WX45_01024 [Clostridium ljungdahlii DSM 13528]OVY48598.1 hypothetical protein WX72_00416 [Clostridium autoethanogenum]
MIKERTGTKFDRQCIDIKDREDIKENLYSGEENLKLKEDNKCDIFTTIVRIKGCNCNVVPVKSSKPLDKSLWLECSKVLARIHVGAPIKIGDIICKNILNTKVDIICTKNVNKITK